MSDDDEEMRPNPRYENLQELLQSAESMQEEIAEALKEAHRIMDGGEAWTGPSTAKIFLEDLGYRHDDLPGIAERLVEDIREELNSCPQEVPVVNNYGGDFPV